MIIKGLEHRKGPTLLQVFLTYTPRNFTIQVELFENSPWTDPTFETGMLGVSNVSLPPLGLNTKLQGLGQKFSKTQIANAHVSPLF